MRDMDVVWYVENAQENIGRVRSQSEGHHILFVSHLFGEPVKHKSIIMH